MKNISVIIPVYNTKPYLEQAIDSIIEQEEFIYEVIIINDGSTDGSGDFLETEYGQNDIVKIIHTENKGQGIGRNLGIENSNGEYIYFFDSDDISINNLFGKFTSILKTNPEIELFCFSGESFLDDNFSTEAATNKSFLSERAYKRNINDVFESGEEAFRSLINNKGFFAGPPLYIFSRNIIQRGKIEFRSSKYEDEDFTHKLFLFAQKVQVSNNIYFRRRVREGSTMQLKRNSEHLVGYIETAQALRKLKSNNFKFSFTQKLLSERVKRFAKEVMMMKYIHSIP